ncbi:MAG: AAA family ATPase [Nitrososphaerota archaeon]
MIEVFRTPLGFTVNAVSDNNDEINLEITKILEREEHLYALVEIKCKPAYSTKKTKLFFGNANLTSTRSRKELANYLKGMQDEIDWHSAIEAIFQRVVQEYYTPEQPVKPRIFEHTAISYVLEPVLVKGHPALIYAAGGAGKSLIAQYMSLLAQNGLTFSGKNDTVYKTLYLDWELDEEEFSRRLSMLTANFASIDDLPLYKHCALPFRDELSSVIKAVLENEIRLVVIDSAGPAIGGDINDAAKVIDFFNCVRKLTSIGATVLILSHVSKQTRKSDEGEGLPIGSVYFENLSRVCWELKQRKADGYMQIGLFCRKSNFGPMKPVGFEVRFEDGMAFIKQVVYEEIEDMAISKAPTSDLVVSVLEALESADVNEIAKQTNIDKQYLWQVLNRLKKKGLVENVGNKWRLVRWNGNGKNSD